MENILIKSKQKINRVTTKFYRYLYSKFNLENKLISITGARGSGKTTLLLQIGNNQDGKEILYLALDDLFF